MKHDDEVFQPIDAVNFVCIIVVLLIIPMIWPIVIGSVWLSTDMKVMRRMPEAAEVGSADSVYDLGLLMIV